MEWKNVEKIISLARIILLYGPPGTGKTRAAMKAGKPASVYNVYLTEETPAAELRGHYIPEGDRFVWKDGPAVSAWREGKRLVLNEIDHASGDALTFLMGLLDDAEVAAMTLPTGETISPAEGFQAVATMNGEPMDLASAMRDRFGISIRIGEPHPDAVASLPKELQNLTVEVDDPDRQVSVRSLKSFAALRSDVGDSVAAQAVFGARSETLLRALTLAADIPKS